MELVTRSDTTDSTNVTPDSLELKRVN